MNAGWTRQQIRDGGWKRGARFIEASAYTHAVEALTVIADQTCDHGPGFCPRIVAQVALGRVGAGALLSTEKPGETVSTLTAQNRALREALNAMLQGPLVVDPCSDSRNFYTVRFADGSEHGDTSREPVATFYTPLHVASKVVEACNAHDALRAENERLRKALQAYIDHVDSGRLIVRWSDEQVSYYEMRDNIGNMDEARAALAENGRTE